MAYGNWAAIFAAFFLMVFTFAEKAPYPSFARDATSASPAEYYDYIVVGGGTAGCALAATLSASSKVLLLERGGMPYDNPNVTHVTGIPKTLVDTSPRSASQRFVSTDGVFNHRGRVLGGSSAINGGFYTRASREEVEEVGWDPQLVNRSYEWVESKVAFRPRLSEWQAAVREGLLEAGVLPDRGFTYEHVQGTKTGGSIFDEDGYRHTAADLLEYADPTMITVYLHATVYQILFTTLAGKRPKAYGIVFSDSKLRNHTALLNSNATDEIIVSAGALGSPQLLMLSGIGPAHHIKAHGIEVILDQQMVGQGMSDNPMNAIPVPLRRAVGSSSVQVVGITNVGSYIETGSGDLVPIFMPGVGQGFTKLASQNIHSNASIPQENSNIQLGIIVEKVARPSSTGYLELRSNDPKDNPRVTFNYFKDPMDLQRCVRGMQIIKSVVESQAISAFRYPSASFESLLRLMARARNNLRKRKNSSSSLEQFCVDTVMTIWHYHGGCQVGRVVDGDYRVVGVDSLRVVDGSTFYASPGPILRPLS